MLHCCKVKIIMSVRGFVREYLYIRTPFVTIFNKIAIQGKGPNGKRTRTPWAYQESPPNCPFHTSLLWGQAFN